MMNNKVSPIGDDWNDYRKTFRTAEEIAETDIQVKIIGEIIEARNSKGISQRELEEQSGVKQPIISRLERGAVDPQLKTILKILRPLGKTLAIVPLNEEHF